MGIPGQVSADRVSTDGMSTGDAARAYAAGRAAARPWARAVRRPWRQGRYCALDLETTGLDLRRDAIISVGAVLIDGGRVIAGSSLYRLVSGPLDPSPAAIAVHALRPADLAGAPPWEETVDDVLRMLTGRILVAHAAWVERAFLRRAFAIRGVREPTAVIDTAALARAAGVARAWPPGAAGAAGRGRIRAEPSLEALAAGLGLPAHEPHHALGDALTTAEVFLALAALLDGGYQGREPRHFGSRDAGQRDAGPSGAGRPATVRSLVSLSRRFSMPAG